MFTEFSPLNRIKKTDEFLKNSLSLLQSLPENKIKLIEYVTFISSPNDYLLNFSIAGLLRLIKNNLVSLLLLPDEKEVIYKRYFHHLIASL